MNIGRTIRQRRSGVRLHRVQQRIEDLKDLRALNQAIERNGDMPLIPWSQAKKKLGPA